MLALTACQSGDDSSTKEASSNRASQTETATEEPSPEGETDDCRVAASLWADRMTDHVLRAKTTAPVMAETLDLDNLDDPSSTIKVLCSEELVQLVLEAHVHMAQANFEIGLCGFAGECDPPKTKKVRGLADKTAPLVGEVRNMIEA